MNRIVVLDDELTPRRAHYNDAGIDIALSTDVDIRPGETLYVPAGVKLHLERDYCAMVMTRSSTFKYGVQVVPTVIDAEYTGEISTIVTNISNETVHLKRGARLAQVVLQKFERFDNEPEPLRCTVRGESKTGSSNE
jgi:hypothetical protein